MSWTSQTDKAVSARYKANFIVLFLAVLTLLLSTYLFLELRDIRAGTFNFADCIPPENHLVWTSSLFIIWCTLLFYCLWSVYWQFAQTFADIKDILDGKNKISRD